MRKHKANKIGSFFTLYLFYMNTKIYLFFVALVSFTSVSAQFADSLQAKIGTTASIASKDYQPLWLVSNKWGTIADRKSDLSTHIMASNTNIFKNEAGKTNGLYIKYGADLYLNNHNNDAFFEQLYLKAGYKNLEFKAGRFEETTGVVDPELSTGSLGISGNSLPIPKIGLAITKFTDIPFTNGFVQFKGTFYHGWLGNDNYIKDAYLHEKSLYLRFGKSRLRVIVGGVHFAEWGGHRQGLTLGNSFKDFMNIVFVKWKNDGSFSDTAANQSYAGDSRIVMEGAVEWIGDKVTLDFYQQTPFESGDGFGFRNIDALRGISATFNNKTTGIQKIVGEFIYTKQMFDFIPIGRRESYYNNWQYRTGWEYNDKIIGTPLFVNRIRGSEYFSTIHPYNWDQSSDSVGRNANIISNRIVGFNLALAGTFFKTLACKAMLTYTKNFGTYDNDEGPFSVGAKTQYYSLLQMALPVLDKKLEIKAAIGFDWGDMTNNVGLNLSALWKIK